MTLFVFMHDCNFKALAREEIECWYKQVLLRFMEDLEGLQGMIRETAVVISGSAALWLLTHGLE